MVLMTHDLALTVKDVLREGTRKARLAARETMDLVRSAMGVKSVVEPE